MRIEAKWIDSFTEVFRLCGVQPGDACAVLSETQSRQVLVQLSELALARLGARGQRRDAARGRLGEIGPKLEQPDQPIVGKVGQPGAEGHTRGVFGHCRPA